MGSRLLRRRDFCYLARQAQRIQRIMLHSITEIPTDLNLWRFTMQFKKSLMTATLVTLGGFAAMSSANAAGTQAGSFNVNMTVVSACTLSAAPLTQNITFGEVAAGGTATANQTNATALSVMCSTGAPYVVKLTPSNSDANGAGVMTGPAPTDLITYQLHSDLEGTVWGSTGILNGEAGNSVSSVGEGMTAAIEHPVYASVTGSTDVTVGNYTDLVSVSVVY